LCATKAIAQGRNQQQEPKEGEKTATKRTTRPLKKEYKKMRASPPSKKILGDCRCGKAPPN